MLNKWMRNSKYKYTSEQLSERAEHSVFAAKLGRKTTDSLTTWNKMKKNKKNNSCISKMLHLYIYINLLKSVPMISD